MGVEEGGCVCRPDRKEEFFYKTQNCQKLPLLSFSALPTIKHLGDGNHWGGEGKDTSPSYMEHITAKKVSYIYKSLPYRTYTYQAASAFWPSNFHAEPNGILPWVITCRIHSQTSLGSMESKERMRNVMFWHKNKCFLKPNHRFCNYNIELNYTRNFSFFLNWLLKPVTFRNHLLFHFYH